MTELEYLQSGCDNRHCKFTLKSSEIIYGVITRYFLPEDNQYYLVRTPQMIQVRKLMEEGDFNEMKKYCDPIDLNTIEKAEHLDSLSDLLVQKQYESGINKIEWEVRKKTWLESLDMFYHNVNLWLEEYKAAGLLRTEEKEVNLWEEYIGNYNAKSILIYIGNEIITLKPRGTFIIGSYGRIDMSGSHGEIIMVQPEWNQWKFINRRPKLEYWEVNEISFKNALKEIING